MTKPARNSWPVTGCEVVASLGLACTLLSACGPVADGTEEAEEKPFKALPLAFEPMGNIPGVDFEEASGIAFHPTRKTLFVVTDEGDVGELRTDGTLIQRRHLLYEDFEGITCNPSTGLLYIVIEGRDNVLEVDSDGLVIRREFGLAREHDGEKLFESQGNGLEGIAFVPDPKHPDGGTFFLVNRSSRAGDDDDPPLILEYELPLSSRATHKLEGSIKSHVRIDIEELSGLHYDAESKMLYAVSDDDDRLFRMTRDGEVLAVISLSVKSPEGIAFDDRGYLYVARDPGGIVRMRPAAGR